MFAPESIKQRQLGFDAALGSQPAPGGRCRQNGTGDRRLPTRRLRQLCVASGMHPPKPLLVVAFVLSGASEALDRIFGITLGTDDDDDDDDDKNDDETDETGTTESVTAASAAAPDDSASMASISIDPHDITFSTITSSHAAPTTLATTTRSGAAVSAASTTSDFVLTATQVAGGSRQRTSESGSTLALAIVIPLLTLIVFISAIVFRMYRTRKEREEAFAAEAVKAKTRAIERQISQLGALSEKYGLEKYQASEKPQDKKDISMDIPIELEADEPEKKRYHGL
ncbi:hypothetical protein BU23DRAFT_549328 [Bimuria novae-zelandiae CBS 107.79]|uniref:Transmembrane protein n=1 Tax=Bimuria novae-zelandiae CBS 107.79 TaxID=1447943 RepID=A0A6A5VUD5_9PLEO|nr:hypothetical protein BU23DRAFT_549328 [Bimuria novae-zelandiae CBS 107.79]